MSQDAPVNGVSTGDASDLASWASSAPVGDPVPFSPGPEGGAARRSASGLRLVRTGGAYGVLLDGVDLEAVVVLADGSVVPVGDDDLEEHWRAVEWAECPALPLPSRREIARSFVAAAQLACASFLDLDPDEAP